MYCSLLTMELLPVHTLSLSASHHTGPSALLEVLRSENKTIHLFKWRNRHSAGTAALGHNRWRAELLPLSRQEKDCRVEATAPSGELWACTPFKLGRVFYRVFTKQKECSKHAVFRNAQITWYTYTYISWYVCVCVQLFNVNGEKPQAGCATDHHSHVTPYEEGCDSCAKHLENTTDFR